MATLSIRRVISYVRADCGFVPLLQAFGKLAAVFGNLCLCPGSS